MGCTVHKDTSIRHKWVQVRLGGGGGYPVDVEGVRHGLHCTQRTHLHQVKACAWGWGGGGGGCYPVDVDGVRHGLHCTQTPASDVSGCRSEGGPRVKGGYCCGFSGGDGGGGRR